MTHELVRSSLLDSVESNLSHNFGLSFLARAQLWPLDTKFGTNSVGIIHNSIRPVLRELVQLGEAKAKLTVVQSVEESAFCIVHFRRQPALLHLRLGGAWK